MANWPEGYSIPSKTEIRPAIPKMHETAHEKDNHERFSLHYLAGVGLTDGESIERMWAGHNALGNATKTMGPGTRHDVLDDHFGFWNWSKYIATGKSLRKKYKDAVKLRNVQQEAHDGFTATISKEKVEEWEAMCRKWDRERYPKAKSKNPYHVEGASISEAEARKELTMEEEQRLKSGEVARHTTSASMFLVLGLELEEEQRRIVSLTKKSKSPTSTQQGSITEQRNRLREKLRAWEQVRSVYMPGLLQYQSDIHSTVAENPEDIPLYLPSSLPPEKRNTICVPRLAAAEQKLRTAQCYDTLDTICHLLNMKSRMVRFKNANIRGQGDGTRSRAIIDRVHERARFAASRYSTARAAILALSGPGDWEQDLQILAAVGEPAALAEEEKKRRQQQLTTFDAEFNNYDKIRFLDTCFPSPYVFLTLPRCLRLRAQAFMKPYTAGDVRSYTDPSRVGQGQGRRGTIEDDADPSLSVQEPTVDEDDMENINLLPEEQSRRDGTGQTQWAKSRSRVKRSVEEVSLLKEEMRRAIVTLEWHANQWRERGTSRPTADSALLEGLAAYAEEHRRLQLSLRAKFQLLWQDPLAEEEVSSTSNVGDEEGEVVVGDGVGVDSDDDEDEDEEVLLEGEDDNDDNDNDNDDNDDNNNNNNDDDDDDNNNNDEENSD
ncbi:hypothetical protein H0H93_005084 [Arthromyces matolae]|nr:hypothetical protein H0H93_005084 [Arthromyces matolae]